jgi:hypothetical protein
VAFGNAKRPFHQNPPLFSSYRHAGHVLGASYPQYFLPQGKNNIYFYLPMAFFKYLIFKDKKNDLDLGNLMEAASRLGLCLVKRGLSTKLSTVDVGNFGTLLQNKYLCNFSMIYLRICGALARPERKGKGLTQRAQECLVER